MKLNPEESRDVGKITLRWGTRTATAITVRHMCNGSPLAHQDERCWMRLRSPPRVAQKDNEGCLALSPRAQRCGWHSPMQVPRTRPATGHAPPRGLGLYIPQTRARCAPPGK